LALFYGGGINQINLLGNKKLFDGDSQGDQFSTGEQFSIEIIEFKGSHSGNLRM